MVAVGDFKDTAAVIAAIKKHFESAKAAPEVQDPSFGKISTGHGLIAKLHTEMESQALTLSVERLRQDENKQDTTAERRKNLVRILADSMINQRLSKLAKAEGAPIIGAEAYRYEQFDFVFTSGIQAQCDPKNWQPALTLIETEIRRALQHGFTDAEFAEAKATALKGAKLRADQADSRKSRDLTSGLVSQIAAKKVFTHPRDGSVRVAKVLATMKKEECHESLVADWKGDDIQVFLGGNLKLAKLSECITSHAW